MMNFFSQMKNGPPKQQAAWSACRQLNLFENLKYYQPTLCGTIPIMVDVESSDLDVICEVKDFDRFEAIICHHYHDYDRFRLKKSAEKVKANFLFKGFEFEIYGKNQPVCEQNAYLHMMTEHMILKREPSLREQVIQLKRNALSTEAAFCDLMQIEGDPYEALILYGKNRGWI